MTSKSGAARPTLAERKPRDMDEVRRLLDGLPPARSSTPPRTQATRVQTVRPAPVRPATTVVQERPGPPAPPPPRAPPTPPTPAKARQDAPRPAPKPAAIEIAGLTKRYGEQYAIRDLRFSVPYGGVTGFVGANGSGKTTTMRLLIGLVRPDAGSAKVLGKPISAPSTYLHRVGSMIETPAFEPELSGEKNLRVLALLGQHDVGRVPTVLRIVGLENSGRKPFRAYSLGMKQRLGIAAALLPDPDLMILDEPTNGLDPSGIREIRELLRRIGDSGKTVFVSSHLLDEVERLCETIVVIDKGRALFEGPTTDLLGGRAGDLEDVVLRMSGGATR